MSGAPLTAPAASCLTEAPAIAGEAVPGMAMPGDLRIWPSQTLLAGNQEARIAHNGEIYTLRRTRAGRLILTK